VTAFVPALNVTVVEPAAAVTPAGTVTAVLLLASDNAVPPAGAEPVRVTVHVAAVPLNTVDGVQAIEATCS
jgi:hypothetical protein